MNRKILGYFLTLFTTLVVPAVIFAGETTEKKSLTIDETIDQAFKPIADTWGGIIFFEIFPGVPFVLVLLVFSAAFFTVAFGFVNIRRFPLAINVVRGKYDEIEQGDGNVSDVTDTDAVNVVDGDLPDTIRDESAHGEVSHFQALATAVSGTVGLGNIAGVAVAIAVGGPGATFWMIVCGLLGMSTKFVECTLGVKYREIDAQGKVLGGPMYYLSKGFESKGKLGKRWGNFLAIFFAIMCIGGSFGGGNAFQSNQATAQLTSMLSLEGGAIKTIIGIIMAILVAIVIIGGIKRIAKVTEKVVPAMAGIYILASLIIIIANITYLPTAVGLIISQAFTPEAGVGGLMGALLVGFQRAAFSNEAGAGSAAIAHSAVNTKYPASEGIVALLEPFIDTVVICTMTALVIIMFNQGLFNYDQQNKNGAIVKEAVVKTVEINGKDVDQAFRNGELIKGASISKVATLNGETVKDAVIRKTEIDGKKVEQAYLKVKVIEGGKVVEKEELIEGAEIVNNVQLGGAVLTSAAYDAVLPGFKYILTLAIVLFAFSTMISWSYYGLQSWKFLFGESNAADITYKILFCIFVVIGSAISLGSVIDFSDAMIFAMVFPNMVGLYFLFPKVREELNRYLDAIKGA